MIDSVHYEELLLRLQTNRLHPVEIVNASAVDLDEGTLRDGYGRCCQSCSAV